MIVSQTDFVSLNAEQSGAEQYCASLRALDSVAHEPVQMKLLAWVMGLPAGIDPADAAQMVMQRQAQVPEASISLQLMKLIETVAEYPRARLATMVRGRRAPLN